MDTIAVRCEVIPDESLTPDKSRVRVIEFIRAQDVPHELRVESRAIKWLEGEKEQAYLIAENVWDPLFDRYIGLVAQVQTGHGWEDVYIHPDDFLIISNEQQYF